ncbi:MAG: LAO/AO transport system kinase [Saprospiraceae bacterium]|jgi:LAO/AO transport system kinase
MAHINPNIQESFAGKSLAVKPIEYYIEGVLSGDRYILAEAITLLESNNEAHKRIAYDILSHVKNNTTKTRRIGITGSPGVGKSTFIESIGQDLIANNHKVAVLTIDPSSAQTHGSILGDKTRMLELAKSPLFFIRPSPSSKHLGGTHQYTYEAICLCEAAGYNDIIIETVGVGQSEIAIRDYTDMMILLMLPGAGDSLQGIKKGIIETTDIIVVNKADGERKKLATEMIKHLSDAQHSSAKAAIPIYKYSSIERTEVSLLPMIDSFFKNKKDLFSVRSFQEIKWLRNRLNQDISRQIDESISRQLDDVKSRKQIAKNSVFKEYLRLSKSIIVSVDL